MEKVHRKGQLYGPFQDLRLRERCFGLLRRGNYTGKRSRLTVMHDDVNHSKGTSTNSASCKILPVHKIDGLLRLTLDWQLRRRHEHR